MDIGKEIKRVIESKGYSAYKTSKLTGIAESHLSKILAGKYKPNLDTLFALAKGLDIDIVEFFGCQRKSTPVIEHKLVVSQRPLYGEDVENFVPVPLLSDPVSLGTGLEITESDVQGTCLIHRRTLRNVGKPYCIFVQGDSMTPVLDNGDMVAVDVTRKDSKRLNKKIVACHTGDFQVTVKQLLVVEDRFHFKAINPRWEEEHAPLITAQKDGLILGQVVWAWKRFE